ARRTAIGTPHGPGRSQTDPTPRPGLPALLIGAGELVRVVTNNNRRVGDVHAETGDESVGSSGGSGPVGSAPVGSPGGPFPSVRVFGRSADGRGGGKGLRGGTSGTVSERPRTGTRSSSA